MKHTEIVDDKILVECPICKNWEEIPIDEQRSHLQNFEIVDWLDEETSFTECKECGKYFLLKWENEIK